jgi:hypothetical protein
MVNNAFIVVLHLEVTMRSSTMNGGWRKALSLDDFGVTFRPFRLFVLYQLLNIFWVSGIPNV